MENNLIEMLTQLFGKSPLQNAPQNQHIENPYYPNEAYPTGQFNNNGYGGNSNMLPLLMSLINGGGNNPMSALSAVLSNGNDSNILTNLLKSQQKSSPQSDEQEHSIPNDDYLL